MEGLKLIAQSTFDRQQKFRSSAGPGTTTSEAAYRYNVIEIGAFGASSTSAATSAAAATAAAAAKRQSVGYGPPTTSSGVRQNGSSKISLNEWMVFEDDLCSFMKKRPIDYVPATTAPSTSFGGELEKPKAGTQSNTTVSSGPSAPSRSASMHSSKVTANSTTAATATTTTTTVTSSGAGNDRVRKDRGKEEIEAVASLKLVCIPRAGVDDAGNPDTDSNTLAIGRETFLRLYVDHMDADHCALYYVAREYDGYHEFNDTPKGVVTKFIGTSEYALIWTFNRRTLETRGLFLDRCQRWRSSDSNSAAAAAAHNANDGSSAPVTPIRKFFGGGGGGGGQAPDGGSPSSTTTTPNKRWTKKQTGTVSASETWSAFRETLNIYRKYIFAPQVLSFVCCVQMLRAFDDQANEEDLPRLKEVEAGIGDVAGGLQGGGVGTGAATDVSIDGTNAPSEAPIINHTQTTTTSSFALITDHNPFDHPSTPPRDEEKLIIPTASHPTNPSNNRHLQQQQREKLLSQTIAVNRIDTSLANKLRHLKMARTILEVIARDNETLTVDVVAATFLDRYHWAMEGMNEAIPALERHISSLEEYLRYLKGRSERLSGLVRSSLTTSVLNFLLSTNTTTTANTTTTSSSRTQSDALSLRCNEADSRTSDRSFDRRPFGGGGGGSSRPPPPHNSGGGRSATFAGAAISARHDGHDDDINAHHRRGQQQQHQEGVGRVDDDDESGPRDQRQGQRRLRVPDIGFYTSYLLRGNYSHRLA